MRSLHRTGGRGRQCRGAALATLPPPRLRARPARGVRAPAKADTGYSEMVEQALMLFIFQQDLGVQLQRALNIEQYDMATRIRERRQKARSCARHAVQLRDPRQQWPLCPPSVRGVLPHRTRVLTTSPAAYRWMRPLHSRPRHAAPRRARAPWTSAPHRWTHSQAR